MTVRDENALAALEIMSRFAANSKWLIYLPPTMSPSATSQRPGLLEHPEEALAYYRSEGIARVICEEKHMGSRTLPESSMLQSRFSVAARGSGFIVMGPTCFPSSARPRARATVQPHIVREL